MSVARWYCCSSVSGFRCFAADNEYESGVSSKCLSVSRATGITGAINGRSGDVFATLSSSWFDCEYVRVNREFGREQCCDAEVFG